MRKNFPLIIGILAACGAIALWIILHFYNPYTNGPIQKEALLNTLFTLFLPACLALASALIKKPSLLLISFLWSLPISLYMVMTPGLFQWFAAASLLYLISGLLMMKNIREER